MKKSLCTFFTLLILLSGCSNKTQIEPSTPETIPNYSYFTQTEDRYVVVSNTGVEYKFLTMEGTLCYLGELEYEGNFDTKQESPSDPSLLFKDGFYGFYSIKGDREKNILIRRMPDNEFCAFYRKTSLPAFDFSVENCIRLELVSGIGFPPQDYAIHTTCGCGIVGATEVKAFLSDIRKQKDPESAGLYDLLQNSDGTREYASIVNVIYGFFEEEPNLAVKMYVTSYNGEAYSVSLDEKEYVLTEEWIEQLQSK